MLAKENKLCHLSSQRSVNSCDSVQNLGPSYTPRLKHDTHSVLSPKTRWLPCTTALTTETLQFACKAYLFFSALFRVNSHFFPTSHKSAYVCKGRRCVPREEMKLYILLHQFQASECLNCFGMVTVSTNPYDMYNN